MSGRNREIGILTAVWPSAYAGGMIVLISLAHVPAALDALNYFDPPKRFLWALMALVLALVGCRHENRLGQQAVWLAFGLLLWMSVRSMFRPVPSAELEVLITWMMPVLMLIVGGGIENGKRARVLGGALLLAGLIQAGIMVFQRVGWDPFFSETTSTMVYKPERMVGTIGYQNQAVDFLSLSSTGIFILARSSFWRLAVLLPMLLVSSLTGSRGGVLAFIAALMVFQLTTIGLQTTWSRRTRWRAGLGTLAVLAVIASSVALIPETRARFQAATSDFQSSPASASRILMARIGLEMFKEKPWSGWGAGEYAFQYLDRLGALLPAEKTHPLLRTIFFAREAHNDLLQFSAEFGVFGIALAAALLLTLGASLARTRNGATSAAAAVGFILTYMVVAGLVAFPWQTSMAGPLAGFLLGWWWPRRDDDDDPPKASLHFPFGIFRMFPATLALGAALWFGLDLFLNLAIPKRLAAGDPQAAERLLPNVDFRYRSLVGAAYAVQGQLDEAEMALCKSRQGFQDVLLWNNLNNVFAKAGKWNQCVAICEKWERCGLAYSNALRNLSVAYEQTGRFGEAADILARQMRLWPMPLNLSDVKRLAILRFRSGHPEVARETLLHYQQKWMGADANTAAEFENLYGVICLALGDKLEAENRFSSALEKNSRLESAQRNLEGLAISPP
jgi:O-antigen ligase/Flp pilus assembly protein TadD